MRAPSIKVASGTKEGRRTVTVTYHAEADYPQMQVMVTTYRDGDGTPALTLTIPTATDADGADSTDDRTYYVLGGVRLTTRTVK